MLRNFLGLVTEKPAFTMYRFKDQLIEATPRQIAGREVVCAV